MAVCRPCQPEHQPSACVDEIAGRQYPQRVCVCQHKPRLAGTCSTCGIAGADAGRADHGPLCSFWDDHCAGCQVYFELVAPDQEQPDLCSTCAAAAPVNDGHGQEEAS